jgi:hypothetical protein
MAGHSLCSESFLQRLREDTKAEVCPTPISSPVAKGHAPTEPKVALPTPAQKQFYSVNLCGESMTNWVSASQGK